MGTRNLTCVVIDGEYKVAQYGQWDGYPEGQGKDILGFISQEDALDMLRSKLARCRFLDVDYDEADKAFAEDHDEKTPKYMGDEDRRSEEQKRWFSRYISRDLGGKILENIATADDEEILLQCALNFAGDSLMCEWAYVIDFDKGTFEVFHGFNREPVKSGERFADFETEDHKFKDADGSTYGYYQVRLVHEFKLNMLPTFEEFMDTITLALNLQEDK